MASNNYAVVIEEPAKAAEVLARLKRMAGEGQKFLQFRFDPETSSFPISCGRESNFPPLPVVEEYGKTVDGAEASKSWDASDHGLDAVDYGNGHFGAYHECNGMGYMTVVNPQDVGPKLVCSACRQPVESLDELEQVPLGIANPKLAGTPMAGEPIAFHERCWKLKVEGSIKQA